MLSIGQVPWLQYLVNTVGNSERNPQDVSAVMEQALKLQDTLLSQLEKNKSVIQELQE